MESEQLKEQKKLEEFLQVIRENLEGLKDRKEDVDRETKELYDAYMEGDTELYSALMVSSTLQDHINRSITANRAALEKSHFGRVDYIDHESNEKYSLYIGKHGITKGTIGLMIMDWRAAAASIYYESSTGESCYRTPEGKALPIKLELKRTFDIEGERLMGFYDSDTAASDELLISYLSRNTDVTLGEIIATIQQEQNRIIRERHNRSMIVQGAAGSGKTTVAVHRISYILYNFADRYDPSEICIIGSSDTLLDYIAGGLPSLDVYNTRQYRMEKLFEYLIGAWFPKKYAIIPEKLQETAELKLKSSVEFAEMAQEWTRQQEKELILIEDVKENDTVLLSSEGISQYLNMFRERSVESKLENLTARLNAGISRAMDGEESDRKKSVQKKYRRYFYKNYRKRNLMQLYEDFLVWVSENGACEGVSFGEWTKRISHGFFDVYDMAIMALLAHDWLDEENDREFAQMYIDEAQDYGASVYYVLRKRMPDTVFMIMGDVSQNINYDSGMNDWKDLREKVFCRPDDGFYTLCRSYRNTIEISRYAERILGKCSFETYPVIPIVRHGKAVGLWREDSEEQLIERVRCLTAGFRKEYRTAALICRDDEEAEMLKAVFQDITIYPAAMTKGLEFDAVILWNPVSKTYESTDRDAKLLYVAVTRALHELHIVWCTDLCPLLESEGQA